MLKVKDLTFSYTKEYNILQDINFELNSKNSMFVFGEQESGRSSLLRILLGIETSFKGEVSYDNIPVSKELFKSTIDVGFIPEKMAFMEGKTVYKNLEYVLKIRRVNKAIQEVRINNALKCFGIENLKDVKVKNLGRFDRIKVALARISLRKLEYIFVDDIFKDMPTSEIKFVVNELKKLQSANDSALVVFSDNKEVADFMESKMFSLSYGVLKEIENV